MKRNWKLFLTAAVLFGLVGCNDQSDDENEKRLQDDGVTRIVATTTMVADMARAIVGEEVEVSGLMAAGVDPHTYNLPISAVAELKRADILFYSGLRLEGRAEELYRPLGDEGGEVLEVAATVPKEDQLTPAGFDSFPDPHVWGDPRIWAKCVKPMTDTIVKVLPERKAAFEANAKKYEEELVKLHDWAVKRVSEVPEANRTLITSHDAFNYFGRAYGFEVIGIQGVSTASEASMVDMQQTAEMIRKKGVKAVFVESSVSPATIGALAKDTGITVGGELFSDSLGPVGAFEEMAGETYDVGTYVGMMKHNINTIVEALK